MTLIGLTPRQRELLDFIRIEIRTKRIAPSFAEMCVHLGASSKNRVFALLKNLEEAGYIIRKHGKRRSIVLTPEAEGYTVHLPNDVDRRLLEHVAGWGSTPETVIASAVAEYLARRP